MNARFENSLLVEPIPGDDLRWRLMRTLTYRVNSGRGQLSISVPRGFITDFASIPRVFWRVILPTGRHREAAVVHDYLYAVGDRHKAVADAIFLEAMTVLGVPRWRRWVMFFAVLFFGGKAWNGHRQRDTVF